MLYSFFVTGSDEEVPLSIARQREEAAGVSFHARKGLVASKPAGGKTGAFRPRYGASSAQLVLRIQVVKRNDAP